jgi:hypothetical protein
MVVEEKAEATIGIQAVGWMGVSPPLMKVFVDGRVVGILRDMTVHEFPVRPGRHEVRLTRDFYRSETVETTLAPGERIDLVVGYRVARQMATAQVAHAAILGLCLGLVLLVNWLGGSIWLGAALAGVAFVPYIIWYVARIFRPGQYLYLSPRST